MRRALLLLALLLAGSAHDGYDEPIQAVGAQHEIAAGTTVSPAAILRATSTVVLPAPEKGHGPAPRPAVRRGDGRDAESIFPLHVAARDAAFLARRMEHRQYAAPDAAARAGLLCSPTTAPPPFPLV